MWCSFNYNILIILYFCTYILSIGNIVSFTVMPIKQFWIELKIERKLHMDLKYV